MDTGLPYLIMRSTARQPRCYGARLHLHSDPQFDNFDMQDCGWLAPLKDQSHIRRQAVAMVRLAFGEDKAERLCLVAPNTKFQDHNMVYILRKEDPWRRDNPVFSLGVCASYRAPGAHPEDDLWFEMEPEHYSMVKFRGIDLHGDKWYVVSFLDEDAYLLIPKRAAHKSLRDAAKKEQAAQQNKA